MAPLFSAEDLTIAFQEPGGLHTVVDHVSFQMQEGEILGVVGESGSGKSMTALAAMGLLSEEAQILSGQIQLGDRDILKMSRQELNTLRGGDMAMIFQEPMTSLNPVMKIGKQVGESLRLHHPKEGTSLTKQEIRSQVLQALQEVGLEHAETVYNQYPHELSGGMRQRVMIAQAMICHPRLLIADEPTTALDVVVQEQILQLLLKLHREKHIAILFISHDLNVIRQLCSQVLVMYQGVIVERGPVRQVLEHPQHAYTKTLVASIPDQIQPAQREKTVLSARNLSVFYSEKGNTILGRRHRRRVVQSACLDVYEGEILGIVGESGSGKSTLAKAIVGLNRDIEGELQMEKDVHPQMVFQDPFGSLNPAHTIGWILSEPLRIMGGNSKEERRQKVCRMLQDVGLDESYYNRYPRELSGGQRQRISIACALLMQSRLLVADEPVSALDVTVQSQILRLLLEMHQKKHLTILFISHDLNIVRHICHRVAVMYQGEIVEMGTAQEVYEHPQHPYTQLLLRASRLSEE